MKIRFDLEDDDVSVFHNKNVHADFYLDSYLEVFVIEDNKEILLFFTTIHSTIVIDFNQLLIELHQTGKEQVLDTFGNANVYTFKKVGSNLLITNFDEFSNSQEWQYTFDFMAFTKAYTNELRQHLKNLVEKDAKIIKRPNFMLLRQGLNELEIVVAP
ncbi:hypothetical protein FC756_13750 [Lysinibacillus mangiferihumi]|uniref:Uncharacterized protein n=1 Tax=Lysinibacillus mangiferihumi TaxID=1130819 RepID=A0A4U2Z0M0_9BACI|nr:hypothetical protein [Lysinibacillus mangiferihumi]TKI67095.1 hypothetical protein FC756_13750 [Lysinibacillus mangiferihumi]